MPQMPGNQSAQFERGSESPLPWSKAARIATSSASVTTNVHESVGRLTASDKLHSGRSSFCTYAGRTDYARCIGIIFLTMQELGTTPA